MSKYKNCNCCKEPLEENFNNFYLRNKKKPELGFVTQCKKCLRIKSLDYRNKNLNYYKKQIKDYDKLHPETRKRINIKYRTTKQKEKREYQKEYFKKNSKTISQYGHRKHNINNKEWNNCKKYFEYECAYCGVSIENNKKRYRGKFVCFDFSKEHIDDEGGDGIENCIPSCHNCNSKKWKFKLNDWYNDKNPVYNLKRYEKILSWIKMYK